MRVWAKGIEPQFKMRQLLLEARVPIIEIGIQVLDYHTDPVALNEHLLRSLGLGS